MVKRTDVGLTAAVAISGGIDSAVILHHVVHDLMDGDGSKVHTFTAVFKNSSDEREKAKRVAEFYHTNHTEVLISRERMASMFPVALQHYPFPRFNIWPWIVVEAVKENGLGCLFIAEGADELFGYSDRSFLEGWAGQLIWVWPAWEEPCRHYDVKLFAPFMAIQDSRLPVIEFYKPPNKELLRREYQGILPGFIIAQSSTSPALGFYKMMGMTREQLQLEASKVWHEVHIRAN